MDRNTLWEVLNLDRWLVALRKESVDRNTNFCPASLCDLPVALRKESVDRNALSDLLMLLIAVSLSARRAWIEIFYYCDHDTDWIVALRKESVDRNA